MNRMYSYNQEIRDRLQERLVLDEYSVKIIVG